MSGRSRAKLKKALDDLYERYDYRRYVDPDPLVFLYDYPDVGDREIVGLIASSLAFGGVRQIMASVESVVSAMGRSPRDFVVSTTPKRMAGIYGRFKHRWAVSSDIVQMLAGIRSMIEIHGSLENGFLEGFSEDDKDIIPAMTRFASRIVCSPDREGTCLIPDPCKKSACKRLNLFLRWMVRNDNVDPGGWEGVPASKLVVPLDIHMFRFASLLGLTGRRQANLETAREVTAQFAEFSPEDPVKYDFSLTRLGIRRDEDRSELLARLGIADVVLEGPE
jgi:uncharacterized protein (TIGR02757 family)